MKATWIGMGLAIAVCVTACGDASAPIADEAAVVSPEGVVAATATPTEAYELATRALSEGRMLSPAGNNAVEHYLASRALASEQARAQAALAELQPYVLIATEQAIARGDAQEASRLQHLIERIDAQAPALPRLRADVAALMREQATRAAAALETPAAAMPATQAASRALTPPASVPAATTAVVPAPTPASAPPPPAASNAVAQEEAQPASPPAAVPRVVQGPRPPRLLQDAQPRYPLPALRARIEGQAEVAFTIQPDGSVRDVRLLSSTADGMFDASAIAVAQRWRFEATGQAHASSRTVRFRLPAGDARDG